MPAARLSISSARIRRWYSSSWSGSSGWTTGNSRVVASAASGSDCIVRSSVSNRVTTWRSSSPRCSVKPDLERVTTRAAPATLDRLLVVLERRPQPVLVEAEDVQLGLLARPAGHGGPALLVDVEHQRGGLLAVVAEQLLEHERDVAHQVDR